jgi:hypothetical protein
MKNLKLAEIRQFLTEEQIESMLSKELIHPRTEEVLDNLATNSRWIEDRNLYIYGDPYDNFDNNNWLYYRGRLRDLKPKHLEINSNFLWALPGIELFSDLTDFSLGLKDPHEALYLKDDSLMILFNQLFQLPKLENICLSFFRAGGGSAADHSRVIEKLLLRVREIFPKAELDKDKDYFPMIIHLNRVEIAA